MSLILISLSLSLLSNIQQLVQLVFLPACCQHLLLLATISIVGSHLNHLPEPVFPSDSAALADRAVYMVYVATQYR
jgi:hypothetical protein